MDPFNNLPWRLPLDIMKQFLSLIDWRDIIRAKRVNKFWLYASSRDEIWQYLYKREFRESIVLSLVHPNKPTYQWLFVARSREITWLPQEGPSRRTYSELPGLLRNEGLGTFNDGDGRRTIGEFKYGTDGFGLHGFGVAIFDDGSYYEGGWEYGMRHGFGIQYSYDYDTTLLETYRGEWAEDLKHGKGVVTWRKECPTFYGVFLKERILGEFMGVFIWPQGDRMEGLFFCNGYPSGFGEHQNPQGGIYLGEYKGLFRHGRGKFIWPDGDQFNGTWKNGIRNGPGLLIRADGTVHYQKWNGEPMTFSLTPSKFPASNANNVNELSNI
eukprot:TRINITY_DN2563_c0_g2_i2.p1 TRINITY_DN2563_c0_g2~~TRINITY_DN2563_c0_g2_i2.p1  ORF type:complete len:326 (-),score=4.46 TRINITY_DN2563_c0_g2_i2:48-1025(-)